MRAMRDIFNSLSVVASLVPLLRTADATGVGVDLIDYDSALVELHVGASGDTINTTNKIDFRLQESDDSTNGSDGTWNDVAATDILGGVSASTTGQMITVDAAGELSKSYKFGYIGTKRWIRVVDDRSGTHTNGTTTAASITRGHPHRMPVPA